MKREIRLTLAFDGDFCDEDCRFKQRNRHRDSGFSCSLFDDHGTTEWIYRTEEGKLVRCDPCLRLEGMAREESNG